MGWLGKGLALGNGVPIGLPTLGSPQMHVAGSPQMAYTQDMPDTFKMQAKFTAYLN